MFTDPKFPFPKDLPTAKEAVLKFLKQDESYGWKGSFHGNVTLFYQDENNYLFDVTHHGEKTDHLGIIINREKGLTYQWIVELIVVGEKWFRLDGDGFETVDNVLRFS